MSILEHLATPKTQADRVFSDCTLSDTVECWRLPNHSGVRLALFLQFHAPDGTPLPADTARIRFAYRNHYPQTVVFERKVACAGGILGTYPVGTLQEIPANRDGMYREELLPGPIPLQREDDSAAVKAAIKLVEPPALAVIAETLAVTFKAQNRQWCSCCSRYFPS
jgi:hypothetical protein